MVTAYVLMQGGPGYAQTAPPLVVSPAQQAEHDAVRRRILQAELDAESASLIKARNRDADRQRAGDSVGQAEAQAAIRTHNQNIALLRRELDWAAPPSQTFLPVAAVREKHELSALPAPTPAAAAMAASCAPAAVQPPRPKWDVFQHRAKRVVAACGPSEESGRPRGVMWFAPGMPSTRHDASAAVDERSVAQTGMPRELPAASVLVYREPGLMPPRTLARRHNDKALDARPVLPASVGLLE
jgi:hypothetical protein